MVIMMVQQQILSIAKDLFLRHGFKAVTVDDIARHAGVSKKTLYEHFTDKDQLVLKALELVEKYFEESECAVSKDSPNAVAEAVSHMQVMEYFLRNLNPNCMPDLQRYYPQAFQAFELHKQNQINYIAANIKRGIKEGLYRKNIDIAFSAWFRFESIMTLLQHTELNKRFNMVEAHLEAMRHFLYGISTLKGHQLIEEHLQSLNKKKSK
jgi:TetR/AcrR family transcriptional regulator, cholesterol catabolism regulator